MKWTKENKIIAKEMILEKIPYEEISAKVNMSIGSIKLLKYKEVLAYNESIKCLICGKDFRQITNKHLKNNHNTTLNDYKIKFPGSILCTPTRSMKYKNFKNPNKGKTYEEIYGEEESVVKKNKISIAGVGRPCALLAGTGISGIRKDTNTFARSTYEANIDRIFIYENKKYTDEFSEDNPRYFFYNNNVRISYQPDRIDIDGLFEKDAAIEIKGYMYPDEWKKIILFRENNKDKKLLVISNDKKYANILYSELEKKYKPLIPLWEDEYQNYKKRPDLYKIGYIPDEKTKFLNDNFINQISISITDGHKIFLANKCISFNKVSLGEKIYIGSVELICISNKRCGADRKSSGVYNYELWEIKTIDGKSFYVSNINKTVIFRCYCPNKINELKAFFQDNCDKNLTYGRKKDSSHLVIMEELWSNADDNKKRILQLINDKITHKGLKEVVCDVSLIEKIESKKGASENFEKWQVSVLEDGIKKQKYILSNFENNTSSYHLYNI